MMYYDVISGTSHSDTRLQHTMPSVQKTEQYKNNQPCSANRIFVFGFRMPAVFANGRRRYCIVEARKPVNTTTQKATK